MTQPVTERETRPQPGGGGNALTRKVGPLPAWGWAALAGGAALVWFALRRRKNSQQAADTAAAAAAGPIAGTACTDAAGNPGFISANGGCDTSLSGTGLPGGGQDAALLAQIRALQGEVSDLQSDVGEPPARPPRRRTEEERETPQQERQENRPPRRPRTRQPPRRRVPPPVT